MKAARESLGLTQEGLAKAVGGSKRGIQNNEAPISVPGGEVIFGLVKLGINANWLLTGDGPMLLADLAPKPARINAEALGIMLEAARKTHPKADTTRQAALAAKFYTVAVSQGLISEADIHPPALDDAA